MLHLLIWLSIFFPVLRHCASHNFHLLILQARISINGDKSLKTMRDFLGRRERLNLRGGRRRGANWETEEIFSVFNKTVSC